MLGIFASVNKIALIVFFITFGLIGYELFMIFKRARTQKKISIPDFNPSKGGIINYTPLSVSQGKVTQSLEHKPTLFKYIIVVVIVCSVLGLSFIAMTFYDRFQSSKKIVAQKKAILTYVASDGIFLYDKDWNELNDISLTSVKIGDTVYVGIKTVAGTDIDKARIRFNATLWENSDETQLFNKDQNVYYKEYTIADGEKALRIEAELHSRVDGWLQQDLYVQ